MTDQPPSEARGGSFAGSGHGGKGLAKQVVLGTGETMVLADYGQRFRARIADGLVFGVGLAAAAIAIYAIVRPEWYFPLNVDPWSSEGYRGVPVTARLVVADVLFFLPFLYEVVAVAWRGRTLGMRTEAIRVVSKKTGQAPSLARAILRGGFPVCLFPVFYGLAIPTSLGIVYGSAGTGPPVHELGPYITVFWWLLVHLSVFWGWDRRGWHDLLAGTVVVTDDPPEPSRRSSR